MAVDAGTVRFNEHTDEAPGSPWSNAAAFTIGGGTNNALFVYVFSTYSGGLDGVLATGDLSIDGGIGNPDAKLGFSSSSNNDCDVFVWLGISSGTYTLTITDTELANSAIQVVGVEHTDVDQTTGYQDFNEEDSGDAGSPEGNIANITSASNHLVIHTTIESDVTNATTDGTSIINNDDLAYGGRNCQIASFTGAAPNVDTTWNSGSGYASGDFSVTAFDIMDAGAVTTAIQDLIGGLGIIPFPR